MQKLRLESKKISKKIYRIYNHSVKVGVFIRKWSVYSAKTDVNNPRI